MSTDYSVQDAFLHSLLHQRAFIQVFLVNGLRLQGRLSGFDQHTLVIKREGDAPMLIAKKRISTIQRSSPE